MNLPEYRAAQRKAYQDYQESVNEATERLTKALMVADQEFFEDAAAEKAYANEPRMRGDVRP